MRVKEIMSKEKIPKTNPSVNMNENIDNAALLMKENNIKRLAVVDDEESVVGNVDANDITRNSDELNEDFLLD